MPDDKAILAALKKFADTVMAKMTTLTVGEPEDQLRGPFEVFMQEVGQALSLKVVCTGETKLAGRLGKPDDPECQHHQQSFGSHALAPFPKCSTDHILTARR